MNYILPLLLALIGFFFVALDSPDPNREYIDKWYITAQYYHKTHGVPASIQLAQAILESAAGRSYIAINARNHFGIKWYKGATKYSPFYSRNNTAWRCYETAAQSWEDHADFMCKHYAFALGKSWQYWCKNCKGYGGEGYWKHIKKIVESYELYKYDI